MSTLSNAAALAPQDISGDAGHPDLADAFVAAFRNHPSGVAVITADVGDGPVALTATSVSSVSVSPPVLVFSLSAKSSSTPTIRSAQTAVVHLLSADTVHLARLCSTSGVDRFADRSAWSHLPTGEPRYTAPPVSIRGRLSGEMRVGNSSVIALEVLEVTFNSSDGAGYEPLVYHNRTWHRLDEHSRLPQ
jgi:flavin reductase (DIM6/NTAB) family NADH-FMN oxidoreductase RutF